MAATNPPILAEVHVAGPLETESRRTRGGKVVETTVQRCLVCDDPIAEVALFYKVGQRVALAPSGGRMKRYVVDRGLRKGETPCRPTSVENL